MFELRTCPSMFIFNLKQQYPDVVGMYAGLHDNRYGNQGSILNIPYVNKPVILFLSSYEAIDWKVNYINNTEENNQQTNIVGVILSDYKGRSSIQGFSQAQTFRHREELGSYFTRSSCDCSTSSPHGNHVDCSKDDIFEDIARLQNTYSIQIVDYFSFNEKEKLMCATNEVPLDFAQIASTSFEKYTNKSKQCAYRYNPGLEKLYEGLSEEHSNIVTFYGEKKSYQVDVKTQVTEASHSFDIHLNKFPVTRKTWGDFLNPSRKIDDSHFTVYYTDSDDVKKIVKKQQVSSMSLNRGGGEEFLGIPLKNLNAYWIGIMRIQQSGFYNISLEKEQSVGRVIVDRRVVVAAGTRDNDEMSQNVFIPKGEHIIEVEYSNTHWASVNVNVSIKSLSSLKKPQQPEEFLTEIKEEYKNIKALYAGVYEPKTKSTVVEIPKITTPIVLYLSSYKSINWQLYNPHHTEIVAVVYGSEKPLTSVQHVEQQKVVNAGEKLGSYRDDEVCKCSSQSKSCGSKFGINIVQSVCKKSADYLRFEAL